MEVFVAKILDDLLGLIKWPVAVLAVVCLPTLMEALNYFHIGNIRFFYFFCGMVVYLLIKILAGAQSNVSMQILAHEFTHIFFALLTFHKVVHIHLNMDESGGAMGFKGKGNWLITVSPYFFPLFLFFMMIGISLFSERLPDGYWVNGILGYFFAYHLESMIVQIHGEQPDFKKEGFLFCTMLLPSANLFFCSMVLAFNNGGFYNMKRYIDVVGALLDKNLSLYIGYITNL